MAKNPLFENLMFETNKEIGTMTRKISLVYTIDDNLNQRFDKTSQAWEKNKEDMQRVMDSLNYDIAQIKNDISKIIIKAEKTISDFRNKAKLEKVQALERKINEKKFENFVTKKRLFELIKKENLKN